MPPKPPDEYFRRIVQNASDAEVDKYKKWLNMPPDVASSAVFANAYKEYWIKPDKFHEYLLDLSGQSVSLSPSNSAQHQKPIVKVEPRELPRFHSKKLPSDLGLIELSDSEEDEKPPAKRVKSKHPQKPPCIEILDSDEETSAEMSKLSSMSRRANQGNVKDGGSEGYSNGTQTEGMQGLVNENARDENGLYRVALRERVARYEILDDIPKRWPIPVEDTAFILNLGRGPSRNVDVTKGGTKEMALDAMIKAEDQDSYGGGSNGHAHRETPVYLLNDLPCRRSTHVCNGGRRCEFFDLSLLDGYTRTDPDDMALTEKIFTQNLSYNDKEGASVLAKTAAFFRAIQGIKCKKRDCKSVPVLRPLKNPPSAEGHNRFVGCPNWSKTGVDEHLLFQFMNGEAPSSGDIHMYENGCADLVHPRHRKRKECTHTHFRDGNFAIGHMVQHPCPVKKIVYTAKDPKSRVAVVIFRGRHSHPPWPSEKPGQAAKGDLKKCLESFGIVGATGAKLDNAATTIALLGMSLSAKHDAYRNKRLLGGKIRHERQSESGAGYDWLGIVDQYEKEQKLAVDEQYIRHIRMEGDIKLAVTMNTTLAKLIHKTRFLVCDFTFKRVRGELDEWEVVVWNEQTNERFTVARIYCNHKSRAAFNCVFDGFFTSVEKATGSPLRFKAFDPAGNILLIHLDMEAAQMQGLGDALLRINNPAVSGIDERNPEILVQHVLKECSIHFERGTEKLIPAVGLHDVERLNQFRGLRTDGDIEAWHMFCKNHWNEDLRNWYANKAMYPSLLVSFNKYLSPIPNDWWDLTPNHTNLVESAHVASNRATGISLLPLTAILKAKERDSEVALSLLATQRACILPNANNSEKSRQAKSVSRRASRKQKRLEHSALDEDLTNTKSRLADATQDAQELRARVKDLTTRKKAAGRTPRHNRVKSAQNHLPASSPTRLTSTITRHNSDRGLVTPGAHWFDVDGPVFDAPGLDYAHRLPNPAPAWSHDLEDTAKTVFLHDTISDLPWPGYDLPDIDLSLPLE